MTDMPPDKGQYQGHCNRRACLKPGATWFNQGTRAYYCGDCAQLLNRANPHHRQMGLSRPLCYFGPEVRESRVGPPTPRS